MKPSSGHKRGIEYFFFTLVGLGILRVVLNSWNVPLPVVPIANIVFGALFLGGPLLALCFAAQDHWTWKMGLTFFVGGLALQTSCYYLNKAVFQIDGIPAQVINAMGQVGLPIWCVGLGALMATLIRDKNIVVPIAIFLGFFDMFLVFSPLGITRIIIKRVPSMLPAIAAQIPVATHETQTQHVAPGALAGPADFMFLAMFLVALFRFDLQPKRTVQVVVPVLLAYMFLVTLIGKPLPALVPIGICVLIVNWKEFKLTKDERIATGVVTMLGLALFTWGMFQKPTDKIIGPSRPAAAQESPKSPS